ncbi:MAG: hypothetical protein QOI12_3692 [Alphaproteobacteria bacterium]|jgi:hypothetical protein|nr:hypothetical protein [Alphaproteobacteria bacterium]
MPHGDVLVAVATVLLFVATLALVYATISMGRRQERLQKEISNETAERERGQRLFEQRAQLIPIWQYISSLSAVNPEQPNSPDAVQIANTLELIAVSVEGGVIDRSVVLRVFRDRFIELYEQVDQSGQLPGYESGFTGRKLLAPCNAAAELYDQLIKERRGADRPRPLEGT